jgi:hypothetical protein
MYRGEIMDHKKYFEGLCDSIDATVFNGDYLYSQDSLCEFRRMLQRWEKRSKIIQESINDITDKE